MKIVQPCALVNLVLLVTISANAQNNEPDLAKFALGLSAESKSWFESLDNVKKLKYYNDKTKWENDRKKWESDEKKWKQKLIKHENKEGYIAFTCAMESIISNMELIYPQYIGEDRKALYENYQHFTSYFHCVVPELLTKTMVEFISVEEKLHILSQHAAFVKIPRFFRDMYAFLTRFEHVSFKDVLLAKSRGHAETIITKLTESKINGRQKEQAVIDFACRYARIRHGVNIYSHHFRSVISAKTKEISENKRLSTLAPSYTETEKSQITVTLPEVLDHIGFLTAWNFTIDDLTFINLVSEIIARPSKDKIYLPYYYDVKDGSGKQLKGVLPFADDNVCPITPRLSTTTEPQK